MQGAGKALQVPCLNVEKDAHFWRFKRRATSFCVAGVAPCDIIRCRKSFCLTGAILLRGGQKMSCILWSAGLDSWTLLISVVGKMPPKARAAEVSMVVGWVSVFGGKRSA